MPTGSHANHAQAPPLTTQLELHHYHLHVHLCLHPPEYLLSVDCYGWQSLHLNISELWVAIHGCALDGKTTQDFSSPYPPSPTSKPSCTPFQIVQPVSRDTSRAADTCPSLSKDFLAGFLSKCILHCHFAQPEHPAARPGAPPNHPTPLGTFLQT